MPKAVKYHTKDGPINTGNVVTAGIAKAAALTLKKPAKAPPKPPAILAQTMGLFNRKVTPNTAGSVTPNRAMRPAEKAPVLNTLLLLRKATANAAFGNAASVLVGDFIYTRAFQMMTSLGSLKVLEVMSEAVNVIAEGEVLQLMNVNDPDITEENYMRVIYSKTARLFEAAAQCSGILAGCTPEEEKGLQDYGRYLGTAFQLIDDLLDYNADGEQLGKNVGDDLNEGKPTLPLLHAMHHGTPEQAQMIRTAIEQGNGRHLLEPVLEAMNACGSLEWTRQRAEEEADKAIAALQVLPDTPWREALIGLAHIAVQRDR